MFITCYDTYRLSRNIRIRIYTFIELNPHLCRSNPFSSPQLLQKLIDTIPLGFNKCIRNMAVHLNKMFNLSTNNTFNHHDGKLRI